MKKYKYFTQWSCYLSGHAASIRLCVARDEHITKKGGSFEFLDPEKRKEKCNRWHKNHREKLKEDTKRWVRENRKKNIERVRRWEKNNPEKVKIMAAKKCAKRKKLGFNPINERVDQSEAHHFTRHYVIFIPEQLHKSVPHSISNLKSIMLINQKVREWLISQEDLCTLKKFGEIVSLDCQIKLNYFFPI